MTTDQIICTNHYQSDSFEEDEVNVDNIKSTDSKYRFDRLEQLIDMDSSLSAVDVAGILRNQNGMNGDTLGLANPKAINQLLAHHSCIFRYKTPEFYISTSNWQLGAYLGYDVLQSLERKKLIVIDTIPADVFLSTEAFKHVKDFKAYKNKIDQFLYFDEDLTLSQKEIEGLIYSNKESFLTYEILGRYYLKRDESSDAKKMFATSLTKELPSVQVREELTEIMNSIN